MEQPTKLAKKFINMPQSRTYRYEFGIILDKVQGLFIDIFTSCAMVVLL